MKFLNFFRFLGPFLKNWWFWTFEWMKIFEWNFQQIFLVEFRETPIQNGWAWPSFDDCHAHFSKTLIFQKCPKNLTKVENFKSFFFILDNHFIGLLYGILNVVILLVYSEKLKENLLLLNTFWTPLYYVSRNISIYKCLRR